MRRVHTASQEPPRRRGLTLIETGSGIVLLLAAILGLVESVQAYSVQQLLQDAARRGCRAAQVPGATNRTIVDAVDKFLAEHDIATASSTVLVNQQPGDVARADLSDEVTVQVTLPAADVLQLPVLPHLLGEFSAASSLALQ